MIGSTPGRAIIRRCSESREFDTVTVPATRSVQYSQLVKTGAATRVLPLLIGDSITPSFTSRSSRQPDRGRIACAIGEMDLFTRQIGIEQAVPGDFTTHSDRSIQVSKPPPAS